MPEAVDHALVVVNDPAPDVILSGTRTATAPRTFLSGGPASIAGTAHSGKTWVSVDALCASLAGNQVWVAVRTLNDRVLGRAIAPLASLAGVQV